MDGNHGRIAPLDPPLIIIIVTTTTCIGLLCDTSVRQQFPKVVTRSTLRRYEFTVVRLQIERADECFGA